MDALTGTRNSIRGQLAAPCPSAKANPKLAGPRLHFWASWPRRIMVWGKGGYCAMWGRGLLGGGTKGLPAHRSQGLASLQQP